MSMKATLSHRAKKRQVDLRMMSGMNRDRLCGIRIEAVRLAIGKETKAEMCRMLSIQANRYAQWISGDRKPDPDILVPLVEMYGVTSDSIYFGKLDGMRPSLAERIAQDFASLKSDRDLQETSSPKAGSAAPLASIVARTL